MIRYECNLGSDVGGRGVGMHPSPCGPYVLYADHVAALKQVEAGRTAPNSAMDAVALIRRYLDVKEHGYTNGAGMLADVEADMRALAQRHE